MYLSTFWGEGGGRAVHGVFMKSLWSLSHPQDPTPLDPPLPCIYNSVLQATDVAEYIPMWYRYLYNIWVLDVEQELNLTDN